MSSYACVRCGKVKLAAPSLAKRAKYCSPDCWYSAGINGKSKPKIECKCEVCSKVIALPPSRRAARFCSQPCMIVWRSQHVAQKRRKRTERECEFCGMRFEVHTCAIKEGRGRFCSRTCLGSYTAAHQEKVSKAETAFLDALERMGLVVFRNERVGRWCPDGIVPLYKTVIEFDGEYWHSLPGIAEKDARKDRELQARRWRVIRVPERDYITDPIGTVQRIYSEVIHR